MAEYIDREKYRPLLQVADGKLASIELLNKMQTADVIEREKVLEDMKTLYDEIYHLVKTENWDKEREIESKIITQALDIINDYIENYTKE